MNTGTLIRRALREREKARAKLDEQIRDLHVLAVKLGVGKRRRRRRKKPKLKVAK